VADLGARNDDVEQAQAPVVEHEAAAPFDVAPGKYMVSTVNVKLPQLLDLEVESMTKEH
jgi:hypothetical protein